MNERTERNRELLTRAFAGLEQGDPGAFLSLFGEDIEWRVMGSSHWSKTIRGLAAVERDLVGPLLARLEGPYRNIPELILADGDHVVVLARGDAQTVEGKRYDNDYCFVFRLADGRIVEVREYMDTKLADAALGS
ncbi:nuclear transport factor 2 family protein [Pelagerythrobacter rhizovicinus]|uniref:Nuclear transport factor 2 family protein n=1 Tax=Pelagerythrobacter rhizovicinus TaxID=2268576 RepID=A0A4Q2KM08_9SPHN|nr:nuclear transport factor 2 family protein [Pelagerythrobacter rhizovicinus]RXZ65280.1 nuclear transport factor 2 family protein [Pelagerythrobacter rhizovicinus]